MKILNIIDVSSVLYGGNFQSPDKYVMGLPIGGMLKLMQYVTTAFAGSESVVLAMDSKSFRKDIFAEYKSGRKLNPSVEVQKVLTYEVLPKCGIACYKFDSYEADDIVNWAVKQLANRFYQTKIITNDMDLAHNVQENVVLRSTMSDANCIQMTTFNKSIIKGVSIPFNTISAYKVFHGCKSDKIPSFTAECGLTGEAIYQRFTKWIQDNCYATYANTANPEFLMTFLNTQVPELSESDNQELLGRIVLVYPANIPQGVQISPTSVDDVDEYKFTLLLSMLNDYKSLRCMKYWRTDVTGDIKSMFYDFGQRFKSGEFAVDNNLPLADTEGVESESLDLDFLKSF